MMLALAVGMIVQEELRDYCIKVEQFILFLSFLRLEFKIRVESKGNNQAALRELSSRK